jgi:hypothetical protein
MRMQYNESPEATGRWECPECGNKRHFVGVDEAGYPGRPWEWDHDGDCPWAESQDDVNAELECYCVCTLTQEMEVGVDGEVDYGTFTGGVDGAHIGMYTRVECGVCDALLWEAPL